MSSLCCHLVSVAIAALGYSGPESSPSPDRARSDIRRPMWSRAATGVSMDITDDRSRAPPKNHLPPKRSAAKPPGTYTNRRHAVRQLSNLPISINCPTTFHPYVLLTQIFSQDHPACDIYSKFSSRAFCVSAPSRPSWNSLPVHSHSIDKVLTF